MGRLLFQGLAFIITLTFVLTVISPVNGNTDEEKLQNQEKKDLKEQEAFRGKFCVNQERTNKGLTYQRICPEFNQNYLKFYLSLFVMISVGALIRTLLRIFDFSLPYTVILMLIGILLGLGARNNVICVDWTMYTRIARMPPELILFIFLPVLIYESAFSMKAHILILALPGMLITTFITAFICQQFFFAYQWSFMKACLYGSIISATDPVAVVAILKEIGTSEMLSISIEGESLLNDGVAILLFEIFRELVAESHTGGNQGLAITWMFFRITIGGPVFGFIMAKISIFFLSRIFNDAPVEVSITLVAAYLTYFIGEAFLHVSGVMAVVALGIVMSAERTCISPEVQGLMHHFWEMLGYLANTVLFVLVGVTISETAINNVTLEDGYYLIFQYFALNIIRFLMIVILSPLLSKIGYGLSWQNMMVMTWGGLRGAVGICLALIVFKDRELCEDILLGPKVLLQTAGIVLLTLLINGTTTKNLLQVLKLTELSVGKIQDMLNAVRQIQAAQHRTLEVLKHDRFLADSNWKLVEGYTNIENPYAKHKIRAKKTTIDRDAEVTPSLLVDAGDNRIAICPKCEGEVEAEPSPEEYREFTEEARLRLIKALKVSCWRQYEQGVLTEEAVQILVDYLEHNEDKRLQMFHTKDLKKYWQVRGFMSWFRDKILPYTVEDMYNDETVSPPDGICSKRIYEIVSKPWFEGVIHCIIILNVIPIIWETVYIANEHHLTFKGILAFLLTNVAFTGIYALEFILKVIGFGCGNYWSSKWNLLDAFVLVVSIVEVILSFIYLKEAEEEADFEAKAADTDFLKFLRFLRLLRITRMLRLCHPLVPRIMSSLNGRLNVQIFLGYDIGKGLATAIEDVGKFLPQMIDHPKVLNRFRGVMEAQRLELVLEMGLLQKEHPGIAIAVKTRHASRAILNQMRDSLLELKEDGLVDEKEYDLLLHSLEGQMKRLWDSPSYMQPRRPEMLIANLQWVAGNPELFNYLFKQSTLLTFAVGDVVFTQGELSNGVFIVCTGVIKIHYEPAYEFLEARDASGEVPNSEIFYEPSFEVEMSDYYTIGGVLGELGVVTGAKRASTVTCETGVVAFHISQSSMQKAMTAFNDHYDSLEGRIWRSYGMKIAAAILPTQPNFQSWTMDKIKAHLELSAVPVGNQYLDMTIPEFIQDVVLIYGQVVNAQDEEEIFTAPCAIPHTVTKIKPFSGSTIIPRVLMIADDELEQDLVKLDDSKSSESIQKCVLAGTKRRFIDEEQIDSMDRQSVTVSFGVRRKPSSHSSRLVNRSRGRYRDNSMHSNISSRSGEGRV